MRKEDAIIIGGGPCGLAAALALRKIGKNPLVIEKGNIVNAIYNYPTHQTFFSSSEKLEIGDVPFTNEELKPKRNQALNYYREVVKRSDIQLHRFEKVTKVEKIAEKQFNVTTDKDVYETAYVVIATGYYDQPNMLHVPGESLDKVSHYFKEAHPYFGMDVVVVGGKNSAVDAAIELQKAGAKVTVLYRGSEYSSSVKPWVLPNFDALVRSELVELVFEAEIIEIKPDSVVYVSNGKTVEIANDFVFAMIGYHPDHAFLQKIGVEIDIETGRPKHNLQTMETNVSGLYIAGVIAAGNNANEIFIENGRFHGEMIMKSIQDKEKDSEI